MWEFNEMILVPYLSESTFKMEAWIAGQEICYCIVVASSGERNLKVSAGAMIAAAAAAVAVAVVDVVVIAG